MPTRAKKLNTSRKLPRSGWLTSLPVEQQEAFRRLYSAAGGEEAFATLAAEYMDAPRSAGRPNLVQERWGELTQMHTLVSSGMKPWAAANKVASRAAHAIGKDSCHRSSLKESWGRWLRDNYPKQSSRLEGERNPAPRITRRHFDARQLAVIGNLVGGRQPGLTQTFNRQTPPEAVLRGLGLRSHQAYAQIATAILGQSPRNDAEN